MTTLTTMIAKSLPAELVALAPTASQRYHVYPLVTGKTVKKTRWIEAPDAELKAAQRWILDTLLYRLAPTSFAHGFVPGRSILTNAAAHVGRRFVVTADIRDFFPSITAQRVDDCLEQLEFDPAHRRSLVQLVTRQGRLPQGAPTSPHLANLVARPLDLRLAGLARQHGWTYTRYADDLTFSTNSSQEFMPPEELLWVIERIVTDEHFRLAADKTHVMPHHQRQTVTGLVVNQRLALPKPRRRILRAMLHRLETAGPGELDLRDLQVAGGHLALARLVDPDGLSDACRGLARLFREALGPGTAASGSDHQHEVDCPSSQETRFTNT
jgi:RNA-directed DNA polymerase